MDQEPHSILMLTKFGDKNAYGKLGVLIATKKDGCHKLLLDYQPADSASPILIVVGSDETQHTAEIIKNSWIVAGGELTHRVYGYAPFGVPDKTGNRKTRRDRLGSIFSSSGNSRIYMLKMHQWPRNPEIDILAFETTVDERFEKYNSRVK